MSGRRTISKTTNGCACRGQSRYRGVTKHHQQGKYEARIGRAHGSKYVYLVSKRAALNQRPAIVCFLALAAISLSRLWIPAVLVTNISSLVQSYNHSSAHPSVELNHPEEQPCAGHV